MVKLVFNPNDKKQITFNKSKSSKKKEVNLNPFQFNETFNETLNQTLNQTLNETLKSDLHLETVKDIIGLENCAYVLNEWYTKAISNLLLIIGPTGCGKTSLIELYCKENSINLYSVKTSETIKTKKDLIRDLICFSEYSSTSFFIKSKSVHKKLILIDEYQNGQTDLLSVTDIQNLLLFKNQESRKKNKKEINAFLKGINDNAGDVTFPPIVIISSDPKGTKLSDLKKSQEVYYINEIPFYTIKTWINKIYQKKFNEPDLIEIIKKCKSDKRLLLNTLNFLKLNKNSKYDNYINSFYKDIDVNIFEFVNLLFDNIELVKLNEIFKIYETDGFLLSNLVFENYLEYNDDIDCIAKSADAISYGETLFANTYKSSKTFLPNDHCVNSLIFPSYYSRNDKPNKNIRPCCLNNRYNIYLNNVKNINKINHENIEPLSIFDIFDIKKFLNQDLIKCRVLNSSQEEFLINILGSVKSVEKLELVYKHFSEFNNLKEVKTKNFTLKFKEKLKFKELN